MSYPSFEQTKLLFLNASDEKSESLPFAKDSTLSDEASILWDNFYVNIDTLNYSEEIAYMANFI